MSNSDWWSRKMGVQPQVTRPADLAAPQPAQYAPPQQPQYPPNVQVTPQAPRCPGCGSGNYGEVGSIPTNHGNVAAMRCYDCGYPIQQSGSGAGRGIVRGAGEAPAGPAQPAIQVPTGGWNPTTIIGRLE